MPKSLPNWPSTFARVFDHIFGEKHLSWKCFFRSSIASVLSAIMVCLAWGIIDPSFFIHYFSSDVLNTLMTATLGITIFNFLPDYLSLLESRYIIKRMSQTQSIVKTLVWFIIDLAFTGFIFIGSSLILIVALNFVFPDVDVLSSVVDVLYILLSGKPIEAVMMRGPIMWSIVRPLADPLPTQIYFYSTYFTSIWVWLYVLSGLIVKLSKPFFSGIGSFKRVFDIENKPLRSLGYVSVLFITLIYIGAPFLFKFVR